MDFSWIPAFMHELGNVPAGLQVAVLGFLYFAMIRVTAIIKARQAQKNGEDPAPTTHNAVENLTEKLLPELEELKDTVRDLAEQCQKVADIQLTQGPKLNGISNELIAIKTNVENLVRR